MHREVGIEPVKGAVRPVLHRIHRSGHEASTLVDLAVVDAVVRLIRFRIDDGLRLASLEVEEVKAIGKRKHNAPLLAQCHRTDLFWHVPGADLPAVGGAAENIAAEAVDEIKALLVHVPVRQDAVESGLNEFASSAAILEQRFGAEDWLVGNHVTYADFRVACVLPFADLAGLPLQDFPRVEAWHARLMDIPAWRDSFAGLDAPELPPPQHHDLAGEPS